MPTYHLGAECTLTRAEVAFLDGQLDQWSRELAAERERADVLMREALGRIEALSAGPVADVGENAAVRTREGPLDERAGDVDPERGLCAVVAAVVAIADGGSVSLIVECCRRRRQP